MSGKLDRFARIALKVIWWWFAIGFAGTVLIKGPRLLGRLSPDHPEAAEAIGGLTAYVLIGIVLFWTRRRLWRKSKSDLESDNLVKPVGKPSDTEHSGSQG